MGSLQYEEEDDPERLFLNSIRSEETKRAYVLFIRKYMKFVGCRTINDLITKFQDVKDIQRRIIDFVIQMKEVEGKSFTCIRNYVTPVVSFYKINDVLLNTKKINRFMPSKTRAKKNRGYEYEEIQKLLEIADDRMRAVILLLVSSGCRIGSIPKLHVRDLERKGDLYKVTVYENEEEEYFTFITPEATQAVDSYLEMRKRYGEQIGPDSILIREQFDVRDPFAITKPRIVTSRALAFQIMQLGERSGIRERTLLKEGEKPASYRKTVPVVHGLRKSFSTFALNADMDIIKRRMLEGHSIGIDEHYCKPSEKDLFETYSSAIDALTINPENRLRRKVEMLTIEKSKVDEALSEIAKMKKKIGLA